MTETNVSRETTDRDAAFLLWMMTLDPIELAKESFFHANHRKMVAEHERRKQELKAQPVSKQQRSKPKHVKGVARAGAKPRVVSYDEVRARFAGYLPATTSQHKAG